MTADLERITRDLRASILDGDAATAARLVDAALDARLGARAILDSALVGAMDEAGRLFEAGEFFVPELLVAARAMKAAMARLEPALEGEPREPAGRVAIGTVTGDLHDIGKNLVATMLRGAGFEVVDLGVDVAPQRFVDAAKDGAQLIALSALLTTTMTSMRQAMAALEASGLRDGVQVMVGGAPVTEAYAAAIGADGYSDNAGAAVTLARDLMKRRPAGR